MTEHKIEHVGTGTVIGKLMIGFNVVMVIVPITMLICEIDEVGEWIEGTMIFYGLRALHVVHLLHGIFHSIGHWLKGKLAIGVWLKKMF